MSEKRPSGTLLFEGFVLCEEMRTENNGKHFFIGVFNDAITFPAFPARLPFLTVAAKVRVLEAAKYDFTFELRDTDNQALAKVNGGFAVVGASNGTVWLPLTVQNIQLARPGTYKAILGLGEDPEIHIKFDAIRVQAVPQVAQAPERPN